MNLNLLVRGQSNAIAMMHADGGGLPADLVREVERLLGFDGSTDQVRLVYDDGDDASGTAFGGTRLIGEWLTPRNGDWRQGWDVAGREQALLNEIGALPAGQRDDPTAVLWLHSESDSTRADLTTEEWVSAVRFDAELVRGALAGQGAATVPYLFVSAMPYWGNDSYHGTDAATDAIRRGMEQLAADAAFNAQIAARMLDTDVDRDTPGAYGGGHIDEADARQTAMRGARAIAEAFADHAKPGSPVALAGGDLADEGPQVVAATRVGANQLRIDVAHDGAAGFQALDADAARGVGWSAGIDGDLVAATAVSIVDADTLLLTFDGGIAAGARLHYGAGYGRLAGADGSGRGNAVYDDQGLPIWVAAEGLAIPGGGGGGTAGGRLVSGGPGEDWLRGGAGADTLSGLDGSDDLQGGAGDDRLAGGRDHDGLTLGAGRDTVLFARGDGYDWVVDFASGTDRLLLQGYAAAEATIRPASFWGMVGTEILLADGDGMFLQGVAGLAAGDITWEGGGPPPASGRLVAGGAGEDWLRGGAGADTLRGQAGSDDLQGLAGDDWLEGGRDHDGLTLGGGRDTVAFARGDGWDWVVDFISGQDRILLTGVTAGQVTQTARSYWDMPGIELDFGGGDGMFLQGVGRLQAGDLVFA